MTEEPKRLRCENIAAVPPSPDPSAGEDSTGPYWTVQELLDRVHEHDFSLQEWQVLVIVRELVGAGRVRSIGRPCDDADCPSNRSELIPAHAVVDLVLPLRPRARPHPGDVFWRSTGKRAYAFVKFREADLMHEWLGKIFAGPRREPPADVEIPPIRASAEGGTARQQQPAPPEPPPTRFVSLGNAIAREAPEPAEQPGTTENPTGASINPTAVPGTNADIGALPGAAGRRQREEALAKAAADFKHDALADIDEDVERFVMSLPAYERQWFATREEQRKNQTSAPRIAAIYLRAGHRGSDVHVERAIYRIRNRSKP